jgi:periplasmic protein CpxP/Spy
MTTGDVCMKSKFNFKLILGAAAIAILTAGCQLSSPTSADPNNSTEEATNTSSTAREVSQASERWSDLNLTDAQKAKMKQIRAQTQTKILAVLSDDQQEKYNAAAQGKQEPSMKVLRSLNLSAEQKQKIRDIQRDQRQQIQAILTPEQQAKMKQNRGSRKQPASN